MFYVKTFYFLSIIICLWFLNFCVINKTRHISSDSLKNTIQYYFGDTEKLLVGYETYGKDIKLGKWNQSVIRSNDKHAYNDDWGKILRALRLPLGCNAVDIGANDGEEGCLVLAVSFRFNKLVLKYAFCFR